MISSKHFLTRAPALVLASVTALLLSGCVTPVPYDYSAFKASRPATLLVLPPVNDSPDVKATYSVLAQVTMPLGEAGYYVIPVTLMDETFRENGLTVPNDIHAVDAQKLRSIFGADAAVYMTVKKYGAVYNVISSEARVELTAKVVDLRNGALLWQGVSAASTAEQNSSNTGGLVGLLVKAVVSQIINSATDASHPMAGLASARMFTPRPVNGMLKGPRSPDYKKD